MKLTKNREIEHQVSKLLARISKSQSSIDYRRFIKNHGNHDYHVSGR